MKKNNMIKSTKKKGTMTKNEIAEILIKKQSINSIAELHDLFCNDEDIKNNRSSIQ